ncbi:MAG TPA: hypothetical protein PK098_03425 [Phycisphaerales bacterium]|nr:hypothetical protein [Phycisphaerales bacterium]
MAISTQKAKTLCTASEFQLVQASSPTALKGRTAAQIKSKLDRARKLRNKFRDLAKKQAGEARGKRAPTGRTAAKGNERTVEKAELFQEVLDRFEQALAAAEKSAKPGATKKKPAVSPSKKTAAKKSSTKKAPAKAAGEKKTVSTEKSAKKPATKAGSASKPATTAAKPAAPVAVPLAAAPIRIGSGSLGAGSGSSFGSLFGSSIAGQQSRETRRKEKSQSTKLAREQSRFAHTSQEKIQGHVGAQTRRSQAKRDSKGG